MLGNTTLLTSAPRRSRHRLRIASLAFVLSAAALAATAGSVLAWSPSSFSTADEQLLFSLTNQDRASAGLNALVNDSYLHKEAEWRAQDMGVRDYFSHEIPPSNNMVFTYMQADGYCFKVAGENIGLSSYGDDVATAEIETAFMASPPHRANILGTWVRMGVGAYKAADGRKLYDVLFSIPCGAAAPKPTPVPTPKPIATSKPASTRAPTAKPTPHPVTTYGASPSSIATGSLAPTDTPAPTQAPSPTASPSPVPASPSPLPSATPATAPDGSETGRIQSFAQVTSLRVHENATSQGPFDSLFQVLFGGLFGW